MYISNSTEKAQVQVRSAGPPMELALLDDAQRVVLVGYGELRGQVPTGLYWLRQRTGTEVSRRILPVGRDGVELEVGLRPHTVAPIPGSAEADPELAQAVQVACDACSAARERKQSGCLVVLRGARPKKLPLLRGPRGLRRLDWTHGEAWHIGWATSAPGPRWLRTRPRKGAAATDHALFLSHHRLHLWFAPVRDREVQGAEASLHTARPGVPWLEQEGRPELRLHAEQALAALRLGDATSIDDLVDQVDLDDCDPWLAILLGALLVHRASTDRRRRPQRAVQALQRLRGILAATEASMGRHPDRLALGHLAAQLGRRLPVVSPQAPGPVRAPPMLAPLFASMQALDEGSDEVLGDSETLVHARDLAVAMGPWVAWEAKPRERGRGRAERLQRRLRRGPQGAAGGPRGVAAPTLALRAMVPRGDSGSDDLETSEAEEAAGEVVEPPVVGDALPDIAGVPVAATIDPEAFDLSRVKDLVERGDVDVATVDAFIAWAEAHPDDYQALAQQVLDSPQILPKAAPEPIDTDDHIASIEAILAEEGIGTDKLFKPASLAGIRSALLHAKQTGCRLRAVGSFRSLSDVRVPRGDGDVLVVALSRFDQVKTLPRHHEAYVGAGCRIGNLNEALDQDGLALPNMGTGDFQTIAGLLSTGSHGTAWHIGDVGALVLAVELATFDPAGDPVLYRIVRPGETVHHRGYRGTDLPVVEVTDDADLFDAAVSSLGCLGILTAVTLRVTDRFFLREDRIAHPWHHFASTFLDQAEEKKRYDVLYSPYADIDEPVLITTRTPVHQANAKVRAVGIELAGREIGRRVARSRLATALKKPHKVANQVNQSVTCGQSTNYCRKSFRTLKLGLKVDATGIELAVPVDRGVDAAKAIRRLVRRRMDRWTRGDDPEAFWRNHAVPTSPISMRLCARSSGLLSMAHAEPGALDGDPWVVFEIPNLRDHTRFDALYHAYVEGTEDLMAAIETKLVHMFDGRPHMGLFHRSGPAELEKAWGDAWTRWKQVRARLDPQGLFGSAFTERMGL